MNDTFIFIQIVLFSLNIRFPLSFPLVEAPKKHIICHSMKQRSHISFNILQVTKDRNE